MARIEGVPREKADRLTRITYRLAERGYRRVPEPLAVTAHHRRLMLGYGAFEKAVESSHKVDSRLKALAEMKVAGMAGC